MRGFTLLELIITLAIFTIVAGILLADYPRFAARINLRRSAQEIALSIREAQFSAFAVRGFQSGGQTIFKSCGINFNKSVSDKEYTLFVDANGDFEYDPPPAAPNELVKKFQVAGTSKIVSLCAGLKTAIPDTCSLNRLDIIYQRPNPDTILKGNGSVYSDLEIIIRSPDGLQRTIVVWSTGQISVE